MSRFAVLPFTLRRSKHSFATGSMTTTTGMVHGLLRLEGDELTVQWRLARKTAYVGGEAQHTDEEYEAVREATIPGSEEKPRLLENRHERQDFLGPSVE